MGNRKILFVIDEIEFKYYEFNPLVTNFWLISELLKREWEVFITTKNKLYLKKDSPCALCFKSYIQNNNILKAENPLPETLNGFNVIFFRPDPPVDVDYVNALHILNFVDTKKTLCINSPEALMGKNEKLLVNDFPNLAPDNVVTSDYSLILDFLHARGEIIIKPLNLCFSSGVFYLKKDDKNINTIIKTATQGGKTTVMVQEFLPAVSRGDRRIIFVCGEILDYCAHKKPSNNDFKFNVHNDKNVTGAIVTDEQKAMECQIAAGLLEKGVYLAGLDVVEDKILEINITSPCFFIKEINSKFNIQLEKIIIDKLENLIKTHSSIGKI